MELRHLRYFQAVAEDLSFSKAAVKLHIAQPPLSQQIRSLEDELGFELFDRSRRNIALTSAGKDFLNEAKQILERVARMERRAKSHADGSVGNLAMAVNTCLIAPDFFAYTLREFKLQNPGMQYTLADYPSFRQLDALMAGEIDVGFLRPPAQMPAMIEIHRLNRDVMQMAVPIGHPFAKKKSVDWKDLEEESFILIEHGISRTFYDDFFAGCRAAGFEPHVKQYTNHFATQLWMISAGFGVAPMPPTPDVSRRSGVAFVPFKSDAPVFEIAMAWRRGTMSPVLQRFVDFVKKRQ